MKGAVVLVNPVAGSGRAARVWQALVEAHPELRQATVVVVGDPAAAGQELASHLSAATRALVVVGGDGTIHHAANALLGLGLGAVPLGLVPAGTGSDLAASLGIPPDPGAALQHLLEGSPRAVDAIEVTVRGERRFAINVASAGISGLVDEEVNALSRRNAATYLTATLRALGRFRPLPCSIEAEGEPWLEAPVLLVAVANGASFGRGMRVAPRAVIDDGLADAVVVRAVPGWLLPWRLVQLYLGRHLETRQVSWRRVRSLRLSPGAPFPPLDLDGEPFPAGEADFKVVAGALRVLA